MTLLTNYPPENSIEGIPMTCEEQLKISCWYATWCNAAGFNDATFKFLENVELLLDNKARNTDLMVKAMERAQRCP